AREAKADDDFVLTLIGHGSYDGVEYKLNLVGPDMPAADLAALCNRIPARRQLVVNATSSSARSPYAFQRAGRAGVTVTKLGRGGDSQKAALDPAKRDLLAKKEDLERRIDVLKYQKAAMTQNDYEQQLKALLIELARVQATLDK